MFFTPKSLIIGLSTLVLTLSVQAQAPQYPSNQAMMMPTQQAPMPPMSKELLKQRLDARLESVKKRLAFDQFQANSYAENFARYQKQQADALNNMMQESEKQRQYILHRIEKQHEIMLQQFENYQIKKDSK